MPLASWSKKVALSLPVVRIHVGLANLVGGQWHGGRRTQIGIAAFVAAAFAVLRGMLLRETLRDTGGGVRTGLGLGRAGLQRVEVDLRVVGVGAVLLVLAEELPVAQPQQTPGPRRGR